MAASQPDQRALIGLTFHKVFAKETAKRQYEGQQADGRGHKKIFPPVSGKSLPTAKVTKRHTSESAAQAAAILVLIGARLYPRIAQ